MPIVLTAGAAAAAKVAPLLSHATGRVGRLVTSLGSETFAQRLLKGNVEYIEVSANTTQKVEQTLFMDADGNIDNIYEEIEDATTHQRQSVKICGSCLASNTPIYGTNQTLADAQQLIPTLEANGSFSWRKVVGKLRRSVNEYVTLWISGEKIETSVDHNFLTNRGWLSAGALRKGMLLVCLSTKGLLPLDSVARVQESLVVEGLNVGTAQGYGVGKWGILTAGSRTCVRGLIRDWQDAVDAYLGTNKAESFYS